MFILDVARGVQAQNKRCKNQCQVGTWPRFSLPQREGKDTCTAEKETRKLNKARKRGYISMGEVKSLTHYLLVTKE